MRAAVIAMALAIVTNIAAVADGFVVGPDNGIVLGRKKAGLDLAVGMSNLIGRREFWPSRTNETAWTSGFDEAELHLKGLNVEDFDKAEMQQIILNAMDFGEAEQITQEPVPGGAEIQRIAGTPEFSGAMQVVGLEVKDLDEAERKQNERGLNVIEFDEAGMKQISLSAMKLGKTERKQIAWEPGSGGATANHVSLYVENFGKAGAGGAEVEQNTWSPEIYGADDAGNAYRSSAIVAENANETEKHRSHWSIASCNEVGVLYGYCWITMGHGEAGVDQTSDAEAKING